MATKKSGRASAITAAFVEHSTPLRRYLSRYFTSRQDIEDLVQETFLRAYVEHRKQGLRHPRGFLFRVAKNVSLNKLAKKSRQITDYLEETSAPETVASEVSSDKHLEAEESLGLYCEALATLPYKCREAFVLRKVHGLSHTEIADRLTVSVSSVEKYLRRGILACDAFVREREGRGNAPTSVATKNGSQSQ